MAEGLDPRKGYLVRVLSDPEASTALSSAGGGPEGVQEVLGRALEAVLSQGAGGSAHGTIAQSWAGT
jgi:hypothetical protein